MDSLTSTTPEQEQANNPSAQSQSEIDETFNKLFSKNEESIDFTKSYEIFIKTHPNATVEEAFYRAIKIGWALAKM